MLPVPVTKFRSTPNSRANLRTEGEACAIPAVDTGISSLPAAGAETATGAGEGTAAGAEAAAGAGEGAAAGATAGADAGAGAGAAATATAAPAAAASTCIITLPCLTLSPTLTSMDLTTPPIEVGISIEALSDSTVIKLCSALTVSPTLIRISITSTVSKSPMSGT